MGNIHGSGSMKGGREMEKRICDRGVDYWQRTAKTEDVQLISTWTEFQNCPARL